MLAANDLMCCSMVLFKPSPKIRDSDPMIEDENGDVFIYDRGSALL